MSFLVNFLLLQVVFSVEAVSYNLKTHDHLGKLTQVINQLKEVEKVVVIPFIHDRKEIDVSGVRNAQFLEDFLDSGLEEEGTVPELQFEQVREMCTNFFVNTYS